MAYRSEDPAARWDRAFERAHDLLLDAIGADEREIGAARTAVSDLRAAADEARKGGAPDARVREMCLVEGALIKKVHATITRLHEWERRRANGKTVDEAAARAFALDAHDEARERARETDRGLELSIINACIEIKEVSHARNLLDHEVVHPWRRNWSRPPLSDEEIERSLRVVEPALTAKAALSRARRNRTPDAVAADAALWQVWDDLVHRLRETEIAVERARQSITKG